ncbi:MAG: hypothetical protein VX968_03030, partial [Bacteroidota bacterium]|nr:hypothetical protein [Bacteroidota bacterium]
MRYCLFIFLFLFSNNILSQKIDYNINLLEDSIKIGDSITLISTIIYPENIEIIQPDSSYNFGSLDFIGKKTFPSFKKDNSINDSTIYFLRTFEIDSIQKIDLSAVILNGDDSLNITSNKESIYLIYQVEDISSKTKENTILSTIKSIFNSEKVITYASIFLIILVCLYVIFRKRIKK